MSLTVTGIDRIELRLDSAAKALDQNLDKLLREIAIGIQKDIQNRMRDPNKTGRIYKRGGKSHRASKEGEAPAIDEGTLVRSIDWDKRGRLKYRVGSNLEYARYLEFGTLKMGERPWLRPSVQKMRSTLKKRIQKMMRSL